MIVGAGATVRVTCAKSGLDSGSGTTYFLVHTTYFLVHGVLVVTRREIEAHRIGQIEVDLLRQLVCLAVLAQQLLLLGRSLCLLEGGHQVRALAFGVSLGKGTSGPFIKGGKEKKWLGRERLGFMHRYHDISASIGTEHSPRQFPP